MIVHKILALLALLTSLTGCAGAEAASMPAPDGAENAIPYMETVLPGEGEYAVEEAMDRLADTPSVEEAVPAVDLPAAEEELPEEPAEAIGLYTRFSPYSGGSLKARDDYGLLLPYVGVKPQKVGYALWGLVTADGQVVTDPVYGQAKAFGPFLFLFKGGEYQSDGTRASDLELTLCGKDGSWTMDATDFHHSILLDGVGLAAAREDGSVIIVAEDGIITQTFSRGALEPYLGAGYSWDDGEGREVVYVGGPIAVSRWDENSPYGNCAAYDCFLDPVTGEMTGEPPAGFAPENGWGDLDEDPVFPGYQYPDRLEDISDGTVYYWGERDGQSNLLDSHGNVLMADFFNPGPGLWEPVIGAGLVGTIQDGAFQYAKIGSGEVVFCYPLEG